MMATRFLLPVIALVTSALLSWFYILSQKPTFSCTGAYHSEIQVAGTRLVSTTNVSVSFLTGRWRS